MSYMKWQNFADRIKWARKRAKMTQQTLGDEVGLSRAAITYWEDPNKNDAEGRNLDNAAKVLDVDPVWLDTGEGEPGSYTMRPGSRGESEEAQELVSLFLKADARGRRTIMAIAAHEADTLGLPTSNVADEHKTSYERSTHKKKKPTRKK